MPVDESAIYPSLLDNVHPPGPGQEIFPTDLLIKYRAANQLLIKNTTHGSRIDTSNLFENLNLPEFFGSSGGSLVVTPDCEAAVLGSNPAISPAYRGLPVLRWAAIWDGTLLKAVL
jgi:hypothetical protein